MNERRSPDGQRPWRGGRRVTDPPPLSTRECADVIGVETDFIRAAIAEGHLKAEKVERPGRRPFYRIYEPDFVAYLRAIKWSRIPDRFKATGTA